MAILFVIGYAMSIQDNPGHSVITNSFLQGDVFHLNTGRNVTPTYDCVVSQDGTGDFNVASSSVDAQPAIQGRINKVSLTGGGSVFIGNGTFTTMEEILPATNVNIFGSYGTFIQNATPTNMNAFNLDHVSNIEINRLNILWHNSGYETNHFNDGFFINQSHNIKIRNININDTNDGVEVYNSTNVWIEDNSVNNSYVHGIDVVSASMNVFVTNNFVSNVTIHECIDIYRVRKAVDVEGNIATGCKSGYHLEGNGSNPDTLTEQIIINGNTAYENRLYGVSIGAVSPYSIISNNALKDNPIGVYGFASGAGLRIVGNSITANYTGIYAQFSETGTEISNNYVKFANVGINVTGGRNTVITGNSLFDNDVGIDCFTESIGSGPCERNIFSNNLIYNSTLEGMRIDGGQRNLIEDNYFRDNSQNTTAGNSELFLTTTNGVSSVNNSIIGNTFSSSKAKNYIEENTSDTAWTKIDENSFLGSNPRAKIVSSGNMTTQFNNMGSSNSTINSALDVGNNNVTTSSYMITKSGTLCGYTYNNGSMIIDGASTC